MTRSLKPSVGPDTSPPGGGHSVVHVRGVGLVGPGLGDWDSARLILNDPARWTHSPTVVPASNRLPPAERRRAGDIVKLSLAVAEQACLGAEVDASTLATVFSASTGDAKNCHSLCEALALPDRLVSPTRFTNSVHNAPAGYWHIACGSRAPSTSLCAFDGSFCAGLLEAATQCTSGQRPVLLVCADVPYPEPLYGVRPIAETMAVALVLDCTASDHDLASIQLSLDRITPTAIDTPGLETLRRAAPTGRALPLLQALAAARTSIVMLDYLEGLAMGVTVVPSLVKGRLAEATP